MLAKDTAGVIYPEKTRAARLLSDPREASVPRFYFHVDDGIGHLDLDGIDLPTADHARTEAVRLAGAMLRDDARRVAVADAWSMEVTDEGGIALLRLSFNLVEVPSRLLAAGS